jgi:hypothetical protein
VTESLKRANQLNDNTPLNNIPLGITKNPPLTTIAQYRDGKRRYTVAYEINDLAIKKFRKFGRGITYTDLIGGLAKHKRQGQNTLKYYLQNATLFTLRKCRPQEYFATAIKSEVMEKELSKNLPIEPTGVTHFSTSPSNDIQSMPIQTLEGYVLPLLPSAPVFIHNMHFKLKISSGHYTELSLKPLQGNNGKRHCEIIGNACINYTFYPGGTVIVEVQCSNNPFRLSDEIDRTRLCAFFGQVRDRMITLLNDTHERIVPDIMEWYVTECDINKDIKVSDALHFSAARIQIKHLDHLFRIYIKSMGKDTVCRVEESRHPHKPAIEVINDEFNPVERIERKITQIQTMICGLPCISRQHQVDDNSNGMTAKQNDDNTSEQASS